jgi:hypothetical protein
MITDILEYIFKLDKAILWWTNICVSGSRYSKWLCLIDRTYFDLCNSVCFMDGWKKRTHIAWWTDELRETRKLQQHVSKIMARSTMDRGATLSYPHWKWALRLRSYEFSHEDHGLDEKIYNQQKNKKLTHSLS